MNDKGKYVVYSIRIPKRLRHLMKSVDVNWSSEIRDYIYRRVRMEYRKKLLSEVRKIHSGFREVDTPPSWVLIREDRERS